MDGILLRWCEHFHVAAISSHDCDAVTVLTDEDESHLGPVR